MDSCRTDTAARPATGPLSQVPSVTFVVPAYNEEGRLGATLEALTGWITSTRPAGINDEIVVSDDGSTDQTVSTAEKWARRHPSIAVLTAPHNRGKGAALRAGFLAGNGDLAVFIDADLPISTDHIAALLAEAEGVDLVTGTRRSALSAFARPQPLIRRMGGRAFLACVNALGLQTTSDPQCGVKVLRRSSMTPIIEACRSDRFAFDVELILRTREAGLVVREAPIEWRHVGGSTLRPVRDGAQTLIDLVKLTCQIRTQP